MALINSNCIRKMETCLLRSASIVNQCFLKSHFITFTGRKRYTPKHVTDNVPKEYDLVYENALKNILGPCRIASTLVGTSTAVASVSTLVYYWPTLNVTDTICLGAAVFITIPLIILVEVLSRRYLLRIYFHEKNDSFAGVYKKFIGGVDKIEYTHKDVSVVTSSKKDTRYYKSNVSILGRPFHIKAQDFLLPKYYNMHTGFMKQDCDTE